MGFEKGKKSRLPNQSYRSREYLTYDEVKKLIAIAELRGRHSIRDQALILLMFRHGLRVGEAARLKWDAVMERGIYIQRSKGSTSGTHPLQRDEIELLRQLKGKYPGSAYLFSNERGDYLTPGAIAKVIERCGKFADLPMPIHPHMLRHSCGYYLAELGMPTRDIQEYLGHRQIQNTVRYTAGNSARFNWIQWELVEM